jgi:predicted O-methyltransferase YrrM
MNFTTDWFSKKEPLWLRTFGCLRERESHALEIGCWEGRASVWMLEHLLLHQNSTLTVIDPFTGSVEHSGKQTEGLESRFDQNIFPYRSRVCKLRAASGEALRKIEKRSYFDLIYVDGSHRAVDVLSDAILAFPLLSMGGYMVFDDYKWRLSPRVRSRPKIAIDAFLSVFQEELELIHKGYQVIVSRRAP